MSGYSHDSQDAIFQNSSALDKQYEFLLTLTHTPSCSEQLLCSDDAVVFHVWHKLAASVYNRDTQNF